MYIYCRPEDDRCWLMNEMNNFAIAKQFASLRTTCTFRPTNYDLELTSCVPFTIAYRSLTNPLPEFGGSVAAPDHRSLASSFYISKLGL